MTKEKVQNKVQAIQWPKKKYKIMYKSTKRTITLHSLKIIDLQHRWILNIDRVYR
jgi:hypothetical protein